LTTIPIANLNGLTLSIILPAGVRRPVLNLPPGAIFALDLVGEAGG